MIPQDVYPLSKREPIYLADPAPSRRALPVKIIAGLASVALFTLGYATPGDGGLVLAALGCGGVFALVYQPTRVATSDRVYTIRLLGRIWRLYGDEETDRLFDEGRW